MVSRDISNLRFIVALALLLLGLPPSLKATEGAGESSLLDGNTRGRLAAAEAIFSSAKLKVSPVTLPRGSSLTLISPEHWSPLGKRLTAALEKAHQRFESLIGPLPPVKTSLRLIDEDTFYLITGAPGWTNALFYRGQIIIPLAESGNFDYENIVRSIRHEYTHAIIHALSGGKCPGWLDEGLAQWAEGSENPALKPALANYLKHEKPIGFDKLQGGFTRLDAKMVAAAYAQSLIAAQALNETFGFAKIRSYLLALKENSNSQAAFKAAFAISQEDFEKRVSGKLVRWSETYNLLARPPASSFRAQTVTFSPRAAPSIGHNPE